MIKIIVAMGKNREIGLNGGLPWHLSADLKHFKEITWGHTVVMGRNTYRSLGKPLPHRRNIVMTHQVITDVETCSSIEEILNLDGDVFIIGGQTLYEAFLPYADELYVTMIDGNFDADTYFPKFEEAEYDDYAGEKLEENGICFTYHKFSRVISLDKPHEKILVNTKKEGAIGFEHK